MQRRILEFMAEVVAEGRSRMYCTSYRGAAQLCPGLMANGALESPLGDCVLIEQRGVPRCRRRSAKYRVPISGVSRNWDAATEELVIVEVGHFDGFGLTQNATVVAVRQVAVQSDDGLRWMTLHVGH